MSKKKQKTVEISPDPPRKRAYIHEKLGRFNLDPASQDYEKTVTIGGKRFKLILDVGHENAQELPDGPEKCASVALYCLRDAESLFDRAHDKYIRYMKRSMEEADRAPDFWTFDNLEKLIRGNFKLRTAYFSRNSGTLYYDIPFDVLGGHGITVFLTQRGRIKDLAME